MRSKTKIVRYLNPLKLGRALFQHDLKIPNALVGKRVLIHTGQKELSLLIREEHTNLALHELFLTKKIGFRIHKEKVKATGKKKNK